MGVRIFVHIKSRLRTELECLQVILKFKSPSKRHANVFFSEQESFL